MDLGLGVGSAYGPGSGLRPASGLNNHAFPIGFLVVLTKALQKPYVFLMCL